MRTSEAPRWDFHEYCEDTGDWDPDELESIHFLSGYKPMGGEDFDLYLLLDTDGDMFVVSVRREDGEWIGNWEGVNEIDIDSHAELLAGLQMAKDSGHLKDSNPRDAVEHSAEWRVDLPEADSRDRTRNIRGESLYLGAARVQHQVFELYYTPRFTRKDGQVLSAIAWAVNGSDEIKWNEDGSIPKGNDRQHIALREAIRRIVEQGFDFKLNRDAHDKIFTLDIPAGATSEPESVPAVRVPVSAEPKIQAQFSDTSTLATTGNQSMTTAKNDTTKKAPKKFTHVTTTASTDEQIHLPDGMSYAQARTWLTTIEQAEEQPVQWDATIDAYPLDGAIALRRVLDRRFGGAVKAGATQATFFGEREVPPYMVEVEIGVGETTHVPWGHFTIPLMPEHKIEAGIDYKNGQLYFTLSGEIKRKYKVTMDEIAEQVRTELQTASIYKGKAFRIHFPTDEEMRERSFNPHNYAPKFIDVAAPTDQLILSQNVLTQVQTSLFTPVLYTQQCRQLGIPLKRGVLLEGKYGTGKTLTASMLSRICTENGWTFIYVKQVRDLEKAMRFARRYEPAVVFAEDIDSVLESKEASRRDEAMNNILNTIDGVDMKRAEQIVVLTTNHVDRINRAMLRPGRLDAVISVLPPDAEAVTKLMRHYARGLLNNATDESLQFAAKLLEGQIPSIVREVVERSKLAAVYRVGAGGNVTLEGRDLQIAAEGMLAHMRLLEEPKQDTRSDVEKAAAVLVSGFQPAAPAQRIVPTVPVALSNGSEIRTEV